MEANIAAIVLAAGRSSRMAPRNKLLETVGGQAIVARVAGVAVASRADPVVVVTGFEAGGIAQALGRLNVVIVHNPAYAEGLSTSLRTGLKALPADCDGALILLADMPGIALGDLNALIGAFTARDAICVPVSEGKRGNPILWGAVHFAEMMTLTGDFGAKRLLARHEAHVIEVPVASSAIFADVDTLSDLARIKRALD